MFITLYLYQLKMNQGSLYHTWNSEVSTGKDREYSGSNRYRQGLPQ
jgi:hypothetical protein